jgi:ketosteroid isomerase-like protein
VDDSNVEIARRGFEAALRGDFARIGELLDPEVKWHGGDPSAVGSCQNREQALAFMRQSPVISGGRFELVDAVGAGSKVVLVMRARAAGNPGAVIANVATFRDGKVVEMEHYPNAADALAAAGITGRAGAA